MQFAKLAIVVAAIAVCSQRRAAAVVQITEWMYNPLGATSAEFVEITNRSLSPIDLTGWSFDDNSRAPGSLSLSSLGILAPGESALITEASAASFRTEWNLAPSVKIVGGSTENLSRNDEINIYDASSVLVDRLTYNDEGSGNVDGPRTQGVSGNPSSLAVLGTNNASAWVLSVVNDNYGSFASASGDRGNPGLFLLVPEPSSALLFVGALVALGKRRRSS